MKQLRRTDAIRKDMAPITQARVDFAGIIEALRIPASMAR